MISRFVNSENNRKSDIKSEKNINMLNFDENVKDIIHQNIDFRDNSLKGATTQSNVS